MGVSSALSVVILFFIQTKNIWVHAAAEILLNDCHRSPNILCTAGESRFPCAHDTDVCYLNNLYSESVACNIFGLFMIFCFPSQ